MSLASEMDKAAKGYVDLTAMADNLFTSWLADYPAEELEWMEQKYGEEVGGAGQWAVRWCTLRTLLAAGLCAEELSPEQGRCREWTWLQC